MKIEKRRIGNKEVSPFTIPSGIITTEVSAIERIANEVPEIGILTTKSIGPEPKPGNREPILAQYPDGFVNAVGLTNPGADEFAKRISKIKIPKDKVLLASIFGKDAAEFVYVAKTLENSVDGFELNLSCPHAKGYGMQLGQDPEMVRKIVDAVKFVTKKPIFAKLTPNVPNIAEIAQAAMNAGAYGITAINTVGPVARMVDCHYVLTNKVGGRSGRGITQIGVKCVKDITDKLGNIPIIGCGGIYTAKDAIAYLNAGATFLGIGSALAGMTETELHEYLIFLSKDIEHESTNYAEGLLKNVDMNYKKFKVMDRTDLAEDFHIFEMDDSLKASAGQFVFAWIPEKGEKPFSVMDTDPLTIGFLERGCFTKEMAKLKKGDELYFRGPYGKGFNLPRWDLYIPKHNGLVLVGGGCGIAGIHLFAKQSADAMIFSGAKDKNHLIPLELYDSEKIFIATQDGSAGYKGLVTELLKQVLDSENMKSGFFVNCGPQAMIDEAVRIELGYVPPERIISSIDYMTRCGVGICGSCANKKGLRTCVEGPFISSQP